jgi:triosephosphate isomerase (TIM)
MNPPSEKEAEALFRGTFALAQKLKSAKIIICPPFPFLFASQKFKSKKMILGAQNVSIKTEGAYTGEVSPEMLADMGVAYVIVGHSEERSLGETNEIIKEKILNLLKSKISPILCVGERERDREGLYLSFIEEELKESLSGVPKAKMKNVIIAYEPIWAIGKDAVREATKEEFIEIKIFIKKVISDICGSEVAHNMPILYGGSVNPENAGLFMEKDCADGLLVGRDSLNLDKFSEILAKIK